MGTCTSTAIHRQKQRPQEHNRTALKNSIVLGVKSPPPLPSLPLAVFPNHQYQQSYCLSTDFDTLLSSSTTKPIFHQTDTNSLIQLYSSNTNTNNNNNINNNNNNNCNIISWMSSSSSVPQVPPRIPVPKTRVPVYHLSPSQQTTTIIRPKNVTSTVSSTNQTGSIRPMSITNRPPPPTTMQTRFGFIPRPTAPGLHQAQASTYASRSRSISPTSHVSTNSSSSSLSSQRLAKAQIISKATSNRSNLPSTTTTMTNNTTSKPKTLRSPRQGDSSISKSNVKSSVQAPTAASRMRSRTPSRTSATSSSSSIASPPPPSSTPSSSQTTAAAAAAATTTIIKTDVTAIRDRYRTHQRMNFFTRRTPLSAANGSPVAGSIQSPGTLAINQENKQSSSISSTTNNSNHDSKVVIPPEIPSSHHNDSTYANVKSISNQPPSAHLAQGNRHRQRAISMLSATSAISDVLNQDTLLEDDNCSLKSDDLMCDYDDTLTIDSNSKNDRIDSHSIASSSNETNKQHNTIISVTPTKPNVSHYQPTSKEHRSVTIAKCSTTTNDKTNASLRESLDELNRLSNRMDHTIDNEQNRRLMTRSVSLKPPPTYLPPLEDAEQITMDIESYRQVMKDVMVVKTILHQLDRLLKHSDGANMTDSMIGSCHEYHDPMFSSRRYSSSLGDGNTRNVIDENSSYDDLLKEIATLRKEKEQDKQTIKLLQEQMYKYSSQTNG
ncbi:unnamed protein product [Rotaria sp. Silwood2]|nr:unnamed protein product [Rotaria sp. Silwood2]CAF2526485.1 unnamed protein product [Rotaria sp. Silwood2]CAF2950200.1 unnamed protein product [Rotaria sp. Silwood2]